MYAHREPLPVCGTDYRSQRCVVEERGTAVQHNFDEVVPMSGGLLDRAYAVGRSRQFTHRPRGSPGPIGRVPADRGEKRSSDLDQATRGWIDLPAACNVRHPTQVVDLDHRAVRQCGGLHQTEVDMPVDEAGHDRARKSRHISPLRSRAPESDRPQLTANLLEHSRSESMTDPQIVNSNPHGHLS
jgi:hypothetical protein